MLWLIEAFSLYQQHIHRLLPTLMPESEQRELLMRVVNRRILLGLEGQVARIEQFVMQAANLPDMVRGMASRAPCRRRNFPAGIAATSTRSTRRIRAPP